MSRSQESVATGSTEEELSLQVERLREELERRNRELEDLRTVASRADAELEQVKKPLEDRVARLERELEQTELRGELTMLRAVENLRVEHQQALRKETERAELWIEEIKKSHATERTQLLEKIAVLEKVGGHAVSSREPSVTRGEGHGGGSITPEGHELSETSADDSPRSAPPHREPVTESSSMATTSSSLSATATPFEPSVTVVAPSSTALMPVVTHTHVSPLSSPTVVTPVVTTSSPPIALSEGVAVPSTSTSSTDVVATMARLLQAQTDAMTAQAKAAAVQNLPSLPCYTGEGTDVVDDGYDKWIQRFRERAIFASWSPEDQLYQLKLHLDKTAMDVFRMLPDTESNNVEDAIAALGKRFKPKDIEELRGLEFHHKTQGDESIDQLGITIQQLGRKAFPTIVGKDFDRLLKGRFYQALLVKWQRKLGAPRPDESFHDLLARARMLEEHERQFSASAESRSGKSGRKSGSADPRKNPSHKKTEPETTRTNPEESTHSSKPKERRCYICKETGHFRRDCPLRSETPGRSKPTNAGSSSNAGTMAADLTEDELEQLLAQKRLAKEGALLPSSNNTVNAASEGKAGAIGSLLEVEVNIEGVPVKALLDTGAQSTIISRSTLHSIVKHLQECDQPVPRLELPTARLYGKDGEKGGKALYITAQVPLVVSLGSNSVTVPVFVQPDSEQACLLGMNALPLLGIEVRQSNGTLILPSELKPGNSSRTTISRISLLTSAVVPSHKGCVVHAEICNPDMALSDGDFLFEPNQKVLGSRGLSALECLVTVEQGKVSLPVDNFQEFTAHLDAGEEIGVLRPCDSSLISSHSTSPPPSTAAVVKTMDPPPERMSRLLQELQLPFDKLSAEEGEQLQAAIYEFSDVFAVDDTELGCTDLVQHSIDTGNHPPIRQQPYRTPVVRRQKMNEMVSDMREQGVVQPSSSPWASPVVLVPKKDGTLRFCIDYRRLNSITRKDVYPLPRVDDILIALGESKYFSSLDLASGYWQIELDKDARKKSAFTTYNGLYEFIRMPFGLCNAPATFQRLMQRVLAGLEYKSCFIYLDDVLVASKTFRDHLTHLCEVFDRLRSSNLRLKPRKCELIRDKVPFLGHVVSTQGIEPDPAKTEKIKNYPTPTDVTEVRRFLGLASYYRRFVPKFASIASPMHSLTKKNMPFQWTDGCESAFSQLKAALSTSPVLVYPRFGPGHSFILETDASTVGLGAVLSQMQDDGTVHPIAYASRSVDKHEKNYGISELETLGLVWAVRYFRPYLLGHPCTVYTDHAACLAILNTPRPSGKLARWALTIQEMDITIKHKAGKRNTNADVLSRSPPVESRTSIINVSEHSSHPPTLPDLEEVRRLQREDSHCSELTAYLTNRVLPDDELTHRRIVLESKQFQVVDGVLYHENPAFPDRSCVVVPEPLRHTLLKESHCGRFAGHLSEKKVYDRLRRHVWWRGMRNDVHKFCRACLECASWKGGRRTCRPPLQPIPVGGAFHRVAVDILQLPITASGNRYVAVFMDYLTKWPEAFAIPDQKADTIAKLFVEQIICRHGIPEELLSDRGTNFLSSVIQEVCQLLNIKKINTSGYHPQTDGLVEKFNSTLIQMIAKSCTVSNRDWDVHLPYLLFAYRVSAQASTRESPFFLVYGRDARLPTETVLSHVRSPYMVDVDDYKCDLLCNLSLAWKLAAENIQSAQKHQKKYYDRSADEVNLKAGDRVMVYMPSELQGDEHKLRRPFYGPYRVLNVTETNAEVRLIDSPNEDPIFVNLNRIRLCHPEQGSATWTGKKKKRQRKKKKPTESVKPAAATTRIHGPMTRSRTKNSPSELT